ncbi:hypothetical protein EDF88_0607 [Buttiauxella sp. BIGb0552]|nr:hypothetical protein EDF88_0607 [Buttiauxella sp. BIGb0552]
MIQNDEPMEISKWVKIVRHILSIYYSVMLVMYSKIYNYNNSDINDAKLKCDSLTLHNLSSPDN